MIGELGVGRPSGSSSVTEPGLAVSAPLDTHTRPRASTWIPKGWFSPPPVMFRALCGLPRGITVTLLLPKFATQMLPC